MHSVFIGCGIVKPKAAHVDWQKVYLKGKYSGSKNPEFHSLKQNNFCSHSWQYLFLKNRLKQRKAVPREYSCNSNGSRKPRSNPVIGKFFENKYGLPFDKICHQEKCKWNFWKNLCFQINREWMICQYEHHSPGDHSANSFLKYKTHKLHNAIRNTDSRISRGLIAIPVMATTSNNNNGNPTG